MSTPHSPAWEEERSHAERVPGWFLQEGKELLAIIRDPALRDGIEPEREEILSVCRQIADALLAEQRRECARLLRQRRGQLNGRPI